MKTQTIIAPNGEEMVVLAKTDFDRLMRVAGAAAEDAADVAAYDAAIADLALENVLPLEVSAEILGGAGLLAAIRKWRGLTQVELAVRAETTQGHISDIEGGNRSLTPAMAEKLAAALDVPVRWLT